MNNKNIVLVGFMGTGKTTVGKLLAKKMNRSFLDTDEVIKKKKNLSILEIFQKKGESCFRQEEEKLCQWIVQQKKLVVATGGGLIIYPTNQKLLLSHTFTVLLYADLIELEKRLVSFQHRPLFGKNWQELWKNRQPLYNRVPFQIDTSQRKPLEVVDIILEHWKTFK